MADSDDTPRQSPAAQRAARKREEKLADLQRDIDDGRVTVRKMSPEEMAEFDKRRSERPERKKR